MIKHVLFCRLDEGKEQELPHLIERFRSMEGRVPMAVSVEAYADFLHSARSYDVVLIVTLNTKEDLEAYQKDPYHCNEVKPYVHSIVSQSATVDYEY